MTKLSTVSYTHEPGLIARLLGMVLKAVSAYGGKVIACMKNCVRLLGYLSINTSIARGCASGREGGGMEGAVRSVLSI